MSSTCRLLNYSKHFSRELDRSANSLRADLTEVYMEFYNLSEKEIE